MMELSAGNGGLSHACSGKTTVVCSSDSPSPSAHHFGKRLNEPTKGQTQQEQQQQHQHHQQQQQQQQQTPSPSSSLAARNILQAHIEHQLQPEPRQQPDADVLPSSVASSPKPNQVGTVLLYGIPIVSLYIESQERLCLAQISNTLLKQFSYNEIHNRRVALGITCVQCTPVQLEILRRAGAMPVSSRRCGMITRREAERLCKSFLGDNAPPRLPEDFAFSVHHKCAWGCRGSFLPSRYNSSRAKCIKCSYCGLFFSPNKFIFHSHRIGPGDKYVQPDAANFNSWRRHMKLSGNPPEEITHAWEDVKAMFNGGTRKRLMTTANSPSSLATTTPAPAVTTGSASSSSSSSSSSIAAQSPKRLKESSPGRGGVVASAVGQFPLRPLNIHHHHGNGGTPSAANSMTALPGGTTSTEITLPFSRNFVMDYMWHAHAQNKAPNGHFHFPNCNLPWIKGPAGSFIFANSSATAGATAAATAPTAASPTQDQTLTSSTNPETPTSNNSPSGTHDRFGSPPSHAYPAATPEVKALSGFYNNSAFKPVIQVNRSASSYTVASTTLALETVAAVAAAAAAAASSYDNEQKSLIRAQAADSQASAMAPTHIKESFSSDDEMVDIETTEEEEKPFDLEQQQQMLSLRRDDGHSDLRHQLGEQMDAPIEVDNSNDGLTWKGLMKKEQTLHPLDSCRIHTPTSSLLSHSPTSSINSEHHVSFHLATKSASSTPEVILPGSPAPGTTIPEQQHQHQHHHHHHHHNCSSSEQQRNVAAAIASAFNHHRHQNLHQPALRQQAAQSPHLPPPPLPPTGAGAIHNDSPTLSPASLVGGRLPADNMLFGAISSNSTNSASSKASSSASFLASNLNTNPTNGGLILNGAATIPPCVNNEFWSVARLSFNRPQPSDYANHHRLPITAAFHRHHHDITKHFQVFRHHGQETPTQTNGVG